MHAGAAEEENQDELATVATCCIDCLLQLAGDAGVQALLALHAQGAAAASSAHAEDGAMVREASYHAMGAAAVQLIKVRGGSVALLAQELVETEAACGGVGATAELALKRAVWMVGRLVSADVEMEGTREGSEVSVKLVPLLCQLLARHPSLAVRVSAASSLSQEGEEAGEVLGGETLRLPPGDAVGVCHALADAAASLAEHGRAAMGGGGGGG